MIKKMSCREILDSLSEYIDAELDPSLCEEIESHMEGCSPCVAFLNTLKKTVVLYKNCGDDQAIPEQVSIDLQQFLRKQCTETPEA